LQDHHEVVVRTAHAALKRINNEPARAALEDFMHTQTLKRSKAKTAKLPGTKPLDAPAKPAEETPSSQPAPVNAPAPAPESPKPE
jgi:hypothetical protein